MIRRPPRSTRTYTLFPYTTLVRSQTRFHLEHFLGLDLEIGRDRFGLGQVQPAQRLLLRAQIEEEFALRLGRRDLDDAPVLENELVDFGLDPVHRKADQTHTDFRRSEERRVGKECVSKGRSRGLPYN